MTEKIRSLVPMAFVNRVPASIEFYRKLGFEKMDEFVPNGESEPSWAWLQSDKAHLMIARASDPVVPSAQAILFYLYCDDVPKMRDELLQRGIEASKITYPFYAPKGEFRVTDPDGYVLMITHT